MEMMDTRAAIRWLNESCDLMTVIVKSLESQPKGETDTLKQELIAAQRAAIEATLNNSIIAAILIGEQVILELPLLMGHSEDYVDWKELVRGFFREIWPLEPALQSPTTANDFAKIPARVGINDFADAVRLVLPYLLPFEIWSVQTELWLDMDKPKPREIVTRYPNEVLTLLSAVIGEEQLHGIYDLKNVLDFIVAAHPNYKSDLRLRALRKVANQ
jgi:hypothetical protein